MEVTNRDLYEFNLWIKSKSKSTPRLREQFKSDSEYEDFMMKYMDDHDNLTIKNDPAIIGNKKRTFSGVSEGAAISEGATYKSDEKFSEREKVSKEMLEKAKEEGVIQKYSDDLWGIISLKSGEWWTAKYDTREKAEEALKAYHANKTFSEEVKKFEVAALLVEHGPDWEDAEIKESKFDAKSKTDAINQFKDKYVKSDHTIEDIKAFLLPDQQQEFYQYQGQLRNDKDSWYRDNGDRSKYRNFSEEGWCVLERWADSNGHDLKKPKYIACKGDRSNVVDREVERVVKTNLTRKEAQELRDKLQFKQKSFSKFDWESVSENPGHSVDEVIGSIMYSITYCHFYHLCTTSYARHMALDTYYKEMPELVDELAELYMAENSEATFKNAVLPKNDSVEYLSDLMLLIDAYISDADPALPSEFVSAIDDIKSLIRSTLYKLKRLDSGQKVFSIK